MAPDLRADVMLQTDCSYSDFDDFASLYADSKRNFCIFHFNIRSFNRNSDNLFLFLSKLPNLPGVIVLSETWFSVNNTREIEGYNGYHVYRQNRRGGGVSIYVRHTLRATLVADTSFVDPDIELCTVRFEINGSDICIMGAYRPPDGNIQRYVETMDPILSRINSKMKAFLIGDMNIDLINPCAYSVDFINCCYSSALLPLIHLPTHVMADSSKCIDHIWCNQVDVLSGVFPVDITDHYPIFAIIDLGVEVGGILKKRFRDHSEYSLNSLQTQLFSFCREFSENDESLEVKTDRFVNGLLGAYNECCPIRTKSLTRGRYFKPWITNSIMKCITRKYKLFKLFKRDQIPFVTYNSYKNILTSVVRRAKQRYYKNKFNMYMNDVKRTWNMANSLIRPKDRKTVDIKLEIGGLEITNQCDVARHFNDYFSSVAVNLDEKIPHVDTSPLSYLDAPVASSMFMQPVTVEHVKSVISEFPCKSCNINEIPSFIFKYCSNILAPPIANLFNESIGTGVFPSCLKLARVIPIHKNGDHKSLNNYRPISTLSFLSKIFERLMFKRLQSFISANNIINCNQFGFRQGSSTSDAIAEFLNYAYESLDGKGVLVSVFLDFSKAFDTVNHVILLSKLDRLGVRGIANEWFKSYLTERKQYVSINNFLSPVKTMSLGVPQGSILGPILFLLYINDMARSTTRLKLVHFADDTTAIFSSRDADSVASVMNDELLKVNKWLSANRLSLNVNKTCYMVIADKNVVMPDIRIDGNVLDRVNKAKFLGVILDERLTFVPHIDTVCKRISSATGMLNRVMFLLPVSVRLKLYYAMIYSRVCYGVTSWGRGNLTSITRLTRTLSRAVRCLKCDDVTRSGLMNFGSVYKFFTALKMFNVIKFDQHVYFSELYGSLVPSHDHSTRFSISFNYNLPQLTKSKCQRGFLFQSVEIWNSLPSFLKQCETTEKFKYLLKIYLLNCQNG